MPGGRAEDPNGKKGEYPTMKNLLKNLFAAMAIIGKGNRKNDGLL